MFDKLLQRLHNLVKPVPEDINVCEFDCGETECRLGYWQRCPRRTPRQGDRAPDRDG